MRQKGYFVNENIQTMSVILSFLFSVSAFVISVCRCTAKDDSLSLSVLVATLSVLTTLLIGWQIYTFIDIRKKVDSIDQIARGVTDRTLRTYNHTVLSYSHIATALLYYSRNDTSNAFESFMNAIEEGQKGLYIEPVHIAINGIMDMAQSNGNKIQISSDRKDYYYKLLSKIENIDGTNKINSIIHNSLAV